MELVDWVTLFLVREKCLNFHLEVSPHFNAQYSEASKLLELGFSMRMNYLSQ